MQKIFLCLVLLLSITPALGDSGNYKQSSYSSKDENNQTHTVICHIYDDKGVYTKESVRDNGRVVLISDNNSGRTTLHYGPTMFSNSCVGKCFK